MAKTPADTHEEHLTLTGLPPGPRQKQFALAVVLTLAIVVLIAGLFSSTQLPAIPQFAAAFIVPVVVTESITAIILYAQFFVTGALALLALASGYLFSAFIVLAWMLTLPGVFAPSGLFGAGLQSAFWLGALRDITLPCFGIAYVLLTEADSSKGAPPHLRGAGIITSAAATATLACATTLLLTAGDALLPHAMLDPVSFSRISWPIYFAGSSVWCLGALALLWFRQRSILDLWLIVVMCGYFLKPILFAFSAGTRYSIQWYTSRVFELMAGTLLLCVLLFEITALYGRLLHAVAAQRREHEARLMTGDAVAATIAHEVKQPLAAMSTHASAGLRWLDRAAPDLREVKAAFDQIIAQAHRAGAVIDSVRANFKRDSGSRTSLDINNVIAETLAFLSTDLQKHRIETEVKANAKLPAVVGDPTRLQQVVVNLVTNAIESMMEQSAERVLWVVSNLHESGQVVVSVRDSGKGIEPNTLDRMFNPAFTTKPHGMGMGLAICRSIIEAHGGKLWASPNESRGASFHFTLPCAH